MTVDGKLETIVAVWSDDFLINKMDSPYPESWKGNPFIVTDYIPVSGSIYGESVVPLLSDEQKISTSLERAIQKQLDHSTIGQRGFSQAALDPANERRFKDGQDFKFNSTEFTIYEGSFNQLSPDVYALLDKSQQSAEELSGIGRLNSGLDPRALNSNVSATASSLVNSNAQRRLLLIMRHISGLLEQMFRKWLDIIVLMDEPMSIRIGGELIDLNGFDINGNFDITLDVVTDGQRQEKAQQLSMVLQQLGSNQNVPQSVTMGLTAEFTNALGMYELGDKLNGISMQMEQAESQPQQPSPEQQIAMQLELQGKQAEITKDTARAKLDEAKAMETFVETERLSYAPIG